MSSVIILDEQVYQRLRELREYAEQHIFTLADMHVRVAQGGQGWAPGDSPEFSCHIPPYTKVVFTVETHPGGVMRHLSVSVNERSPHPVVLEQLLPYLGFAGGLAQCYSFLDPNGQAINVLQPYTPAGSQQPDVTP